MFAGLWVVLVLLVATEGASGGLIVPRTRQIAVWEGQELVYHGAFGVRLNTSSQKLGRVQLFGWAGRHFEIEFTLHATLEQLNVCQVLSVGHVSSRPTLSPDKVSGRTLIVTCPLRELHGLLHNVSVRAPGCASGVDDCGDWYVEIKATTLEEEAEVVTDRWSIQETLRPFEPKPSPPPPPPLLPSPDDNARRTSLSEWMTVIFVVGLMIVMVLIVSSLCHGLRHGPAIVSLIVIYELTRGWVLSSPQNERVEQVVLQYSPEDVLEWTIPDPGWITDQALATTLRDQYPTCRAALEPPASEPFLVGAGPDLTLTVLRDLLQGSYYGKGVLRLQSTELLSSGFVRVRLEGNSSGEMAVAVHTQTAQQAGCVLHRLHLGCQLLWRMHVGEETNTTSAPALALDCPASALESFDVSLTDFTDHTALNLTVSTTWIQSLSNPTPVSMTTRQFLSIHKGILPLKTAWDLLWMMLTTQCPQSVRSSCTTLQLLLIGGVTMILAIVAFVLWFVFVYLPYRKAQKEAARAVSRRLRQMA